MIKNCLAIILVLIFSCLITSAQITPEDEGRKAADNFIVLLKNNKIDDCLKLVTVSVTKIYPEATLRKEFEKLARLFKHYQTPITNFSVGYPSEGVGAFGHDSFGAWEYRAAYLFKDSSGKQVYSFEVYFDDSELVDKVKYFESDRLTDYPQLRRIGSAPILVQPPGN